jgi:exoribonuclease R
MPQRRIHVTRPASGTSVAESADLRLRFDAIRAELDVPAEFPPEVLAEARAAVASADLPERDETGVPFVTIDPPGSMDLDQAVHLERDGDGYRVRYAIADVPAFVRPGGAVDAEARRRGQTIYAPDRRTPLHPTELSEGAASLLPGEVRPAFVWDLRAGADGELVSAEVCRALVRSRQRHDYGGVQRAVDDGSADELLMLLRELGEKRIECERRRGGASLPLPEQEVAEDEQGHYRLSFRPPLPSEDWNAQISLMTGMAAAAMMVEGGIGILRTMPEPEHHAVGRFRRAARGLGIDWPQGEPYGEFLRSLDRTNPGHLALIHEATSLFRGAGYTAFDGAAPEQATHAAVAAAYAHVTAPLRRLVDRFGLLVCDALSRGEVVPDWVREALPTLPAAMAASDRRTSAVERACADAVEAAVLQDRVGQAFPASVVDLNGKGEHRTATVQVLEPAVLARADGDAELGAEVTVRLVEAEIATSTVRFAIQE